MNPATSTIKSTLRHKISNGFVLFTTIWSSAIILVMASHAKMLTSDDLLTLVNIPVLTDDNKVGQFITEYSQSDAIDDVHASASGIASIKKSALIEQPLNNSNEMGQQGRKGVIDKVAITLDHTHRFQSGNPLDITVTVTDTFGNGLAGLNTENIDIGKHKGNTLNWMDNNDGSYTTTLTLTDVGSNDLTTFINSTRSPLTAVQVNNAAGTSHVDKVKITNIEKRVSGTDSIAIIELIDKYGNLVTSETEITVNIDGQAYTRPAKEGKTGIYHVTLPELKAGNHNINASVNGKYSTDTTLVVSPIQSSRKNQTEQVEKIKKALWAILS
ncbi:hypothetical protein ABN239_16480 [Providencia vermicola]|uniref:hypothetical protein n=1 Tax=Providencia vermicola TaxID=333965 RepID=UPI0032DB62E5